MMYSQTPQSYFPGYPYDQAYPSFYAESDTIAMSILKSSTSISYNDETQSSSSSPSYSDDGTLVDEIATDATYCKLKNTPALSPYASLTRFTFENASYMPPQAFFSLLESAQGLTELIIRNVAFEPEATSRLLPARHFDLVSFTDVKIHLQTMVNFTSNVFSIDCLHLSRLTLVDDGAILPSLWHQPQVRSLSIDVPHSTQPDHCNHLAYLLPLSERSKQPLWYIWDLSALRVSINGDAWDRKTIKDILKELRYATMTPHLLSLSINLLDVILRVPDALHTIDTLQIRIENWDEHLQILRLLTHLHRILALPHHIHTLELLVDHDISESDWPNTRPDTCELFQFGSMRLYDQRTPIDLLIRVRRGTEDIKRGELETWWYDSLGPYWDLQYFTLRIVE